MQGNSLFIHGKHWGSCWSLGHAGYRCRSATAASLLCPLLPPATSMGSRVSDKRGSSVIWKASGTGLHLCGLASPQQLPGGSYSKESACNVGDLGQQDSLEKGMATHSSTLAREFHGQRSLAGYSPLDCKESAMTERLTLFHWSIMVAEVEAWGSLADSGPLYVVCFVLTESCSCLRNSETDLPLSDFTV